MWADTTVFYADDRDATYNYHARYKERYKPFPNKTENDFIRKWDKAGYQQYINNSPRKYPQYDYYIIRIIRRNGRYIADGFIIEDYHENKTRVKTAM